MKDARVFSRWPVRVCVDSSKPVEAFIDMLSLSRCDELLCRVSSFANAAIAFSDNIKVHRL